MFRSLSQKVLLATLFSFCFIMTIVVVSQVIFFNTYYEKIKIKNMNEDIDKIVQMMESGESKIEIYLKIKEFKEEQNGFIVSNYFSGERRYGELTVSDGEFNYILFFENFDDIYEYPIQLSSSFPMEAVKYDNVLVPLTINSVETGYEAEGDIIRSDFYLNYQLFVSELGDDLIVDEVEIVESTGGFFGGFFTETSVDDESDFVNINREFSLGDEKIVLTAFGSLQPVDEALEIMSSFYVYFYILAVVISVIISYVFSKLIVKPVLHLNDVATCITNQQFDAKSNLSRNDEIGELSDSLNLISTRLGKSLEELKSTNIKLNEKYHSQLEIVKNRDEFVQNVSHELKTPLGIIKGYAEGIADSIKEDKKEAYLQTIIEEVDRMNKLIYSMLESARKEEESGDFTMEDANLYDIVEDVIELFKIRLIDKRLQINYEGETSLSKMDVSKIKQVLINLFDNAVKFSYEDTIITVRCHESEIYNEFYIDNTCDSFNDDKLMNVWERFYKDEMNNNTAKGHGLGLSISKNILMAHNAEFGAKKTKSGVRFYFKLRKEN